MNPRVLYFGCGENTGHFLWKSPWLYADDSYRSLFGHIVDSGYCPPGNKPKGFVNLLHLHKWTIISWWDTSIDQRPGSHSTFLIEAPGLTINQAVDFARQAFPAVFSRLSFTLVS